MDVSFILATDRPYDDYAAKVIASIKTADKAGMSFEIVVVSPYGVYDADVIWVPDPEPGTGGCHAYNLAYKKSCGDYIIGAVDTLLVNPRVLDLVDYLKSPVFDGKRFKIVTMQPPGSVGGMDFINIDPVPRYPRAGHIAAARVTIETELNGWLLNPQFHHGAVDQWLGYWTAVHGELAVWHHDCATINAVDHSTRPHCSKYDDEDRETMRRLVREHQSGQRTVYAP